MIGGSLVVADGVLDELRQQGATVRRFGGDDRYGTAGLVVDLLDC